MKIRIASALIFLAFSLSFGQSGHGFSYDNYNSIYGVSQNPAFSVESKTKWHVNGLSYSNLNFTNVGEISPYDLNYLNSPNGFNGIDFTSSFPPEETTNNAHSERDWLLPSVIYKVNEKVAVGLLLRSRAVTNYSNFSGSLFEVLNNGDNPDRTIDGYPTTGFNFTNTAHYWNEIGLNFSVSVVNTDKHVIKLGATAKWLQGQGVVNMTGSNFQSNLNNPNQLEITNGDITYLNTFKETDKAESNVITGPFQRFLEKQTSTPSNFGGDAGLIWEIRTGGTNRLDRGVSESAVNLYKVKIAASVLDIGQITYDTDPNDELGVLNETLIVNQSFSATVQNFYEDNTLINVLRQNVGENVTRRQPRGEVVVALPTALNVNIDYLINNDKNYYVNFNYLHPVRENTEAFSNQRMQLLTVTPRYEQPDWSIYLPISYGFETDFGLGIGGRYKYVTAGLSIPELGGVNYLFFGLNVPITKL